MLMMLMRLLVVFSLGLCSGLLCAGEQQLNGHHVHAAGWI
jgi:hypothetical protein